MRACNNLEHPWSNVINNSKNLLGDTINILLKHEDEPQVMVDLT